MLFEYKLGFLFIIKILVLVIAILYKKKQLNKVTSYIKQLRTKKTSIYSFRNLELDRLF